MACALALAACHGMREAESGPAVGVSPDVATHAKTLLDTEIASIKSGDGKAALALFDADAILLGGSPHKIDADGLVATLGDVEPHDAVSSVKLAKLVVGGDDKTAWVMADLAITKTSREPGSKPTTTTESMHVTQLLSAAAGWKVVAAAATPSREARRRRDVFPMLGLTGDPGPLAALAAAPDKLAGALAADPNAVVVLNENAYAVGADAGKKLLAPWQGRPMSVDGKVREIHKDGYGFVQANIDWNEPGGKPYRFMAQVIALPKPDGSWSVVAAQYVAL